MNTAQIRPGSNVAVVGLGGIGLNAIIGAKLAGANEIMHLKQQGLFQQCKSPIKLLNEGYYSNNGLTSS